MQRSSVAQMLGGKTMKGKKARPGARCIWPGLTHQRSGRIRVET